MVEPLAYLNGKYVPLSQAALPLTDGGFINGATVTDNCRSWHGRLFRWADHQARFRRDCETCRIPLTLSDSEISSIAQRLLGADDRHVVTFATPQTFTLFTRPVDHGRNQRFQSDGATLKVVGHQPVSAGAVLPPQPKHRSRMVWHIAEVLAGDAVAVLLDRPDGTLTETAIACVLAVIDGNLVTPPRSLILDSISLKVALELAADAGIKVIEQEIRQGDWTRASEMLLAGTGFGIASVRQIDEHSFKLNGPAFQTLSAAWADAVAQ